MIRVIKIGRCEIETDNQEFFRKTVGILVKEGKVKGKDFIVTEITQNLKRKEVNSKRQ